MTDLSKTPMALCASETSGTSPPPCSQASAGNRYARAKAEAAGTVEHKARYRAKRIAAGTVASAKRRYKIKRIAAIGIAQWLINRGPAAVLDFDFDDGRAPNFDFDDGAPAPTLRHEGSV